MRRLQPWLETIWHADENDLEHWGGTRRRANGRERKARERRRRREKKKRKKKRKKGEGKGEEEKDDGDGDGDGDDDDEEEDDDDGDDDNDGDDDEDDVAGEDDDDDDDDKGKILKKPKGKPGIKIAKQRRKNNRSPIRKSKVTCCFAGLAGYSCHTGRLDIQARYHVPEAEKKKNNFSENARCCNTCYQRFTYSNVTCCFAGLAGYSCHTGGLDIQARHHVPEAEKKKNNFSENARCCNTCYQRFMYSNFTCCFAGLAGYSCHTGGLTLKPYHVPEAEKKKNNFSKNARCCRTCFRHFKYSNVTCCFAGLAGYSCHTGRSIFELRIWFGSREKEKQLLRERQVLRYVFSTFQVFGRHLLLRRACGLFLPHGKARCSSYDQRSGSREKEKQLFQERQVLRNVLSILS